MKHIPNPHDVVRAVEQDLLTLPDDLPVPIDDGACNHLRGMSLPSLALPSTDGMAVDLHSLPGRNILYCYPRTGEPDKPSPDGWDAIPGARGCTPQSCAFRDHFTALAALGAGVWGLSTQTTAYQRAAKQRLRLPFQLLSDNSLHFATAMRLPLFEAGQMTLIRRVTLLLRDGKVEMVWYPVFPPQRNASDVLAWLAEHPL
ncbi:MAG: redoxin family protein [Herpetosiphon sp.]